MRTGVIPLAALDAVCDPMLRGQPIQVYLYLLGELRLQEWRKVKIHAVRRALRISTRGAIASIKVLVEQGYLLREREPASLGGAYRYLLVEEPSPRVSPTAPPQAA